MQSKHNSADIEFTERRRSELGRWGTVAYLALLWIYIIFKWDEWNKFQPYEVGDFLAGAFGPLAFFWLVLGYFQQGAELRQSTIALQQQAAEFSNSVAEQRAFFELNKTEFERERAVALHEAEETIRKAQPRFYFTTSEMNPIGEYKKFKTTLLNLGPPCSHLHITCSPTEIIFSTITRRELSTGERTSFEMGYLKSVAPEDVYLKISYIDTFGNPKHQLAKVIYFTGERQGLTVTGEMELLLADSTPAFPVSKVAAMRRLRDPSAETPPASL